MKTKIIIAALILGVVALICYAQPPPIGPLIMRFLDLTDVDEATYVAQAGKYIKVNAGETAVEFGTPAGAGDLLADGTVPLTANWDVGNFDITLKALTGDGTIEGATLTEGGTGVYNITESDAVYEPIVTEGSLANDTIIEADLKSTNAPTDNWLLSYDLASLGFTWVAGGGGAGDLLADGTIPLTANWDVGAFTITALRFVSDQATGTAPFTVASTTEVANLKAATATTATVGTTVTITDNENTAENNPLVFVENGDLDGGNLGLESDGDAYYTPSTGVITATGFVGALTGNVTGNADTATTAALATTVTITDNEATAENNPLVFVENGDLDGGNLGLESDGTTYYTPSTGVITATGFAGALTGNVTGNADTATTATTATTANAGDAALDFFGAGVTSVTDATVCTDIEGTGLSIAAGVLNWAAASTDLTDTAAILYELELDTFVELDTQIADKALVNKADGAVWLGVHDFGGADLELPQASPGVPGVDGGIELDFTDGSVVIQHGSAHAELGASTDVVVGKLIHSFSATLAMPDGLQSEIDNWPLKAIESTVFPHGIVVTRIRIKTSAASTYAINVENWDDPTTINGANPTIDAITTSASTEATEDTITYSTIAAGQIIMLDLPTTDIGWVTIDVEYYEPAG